jgi:predicted N-acetyltransferase YhbS
MIRVHDEGRDDIQARETLLDAAFGRAERFAKTCERLREGRLPADELSFVATDDGRLIGTLRFWHVAAGPGRAALMLGPLAVDEAYRSAGIGGQLMRVGLSRAESLGHACVLLVGDAPYYRRFGFDAALTGGLWLPGPYARERFLGLELRAGALSGAAGLVNATGALQPEPHFAAQLSAA